jgi:hypothetical protein
VEAARSTASTAKRRKLPQGRVWKPLFATLRAPSTRTTIRIKFDGSPPLVAIYLATLSFMLCLNKEFSDFEQRKELHESMARKSEMTLTLLLILLFPCYAFM